MEFKVLTLRYSPALGALDDAPLLALARDHEVLGVREHFFVVQDVPHLLCVVSCRPRAEQSAKATPSTTTAAATVATPPPPTEPAPSSSRSAAELTPAERQLYETIRRWRFETAQRDGVPAYVVLTNRDVLALVHERPDSLAGLGRVRGIGKAKVERYGNELLALLRGEALTPGPTLVPVATEPAEAEAEADADA